jgi:8-oxo-dGTP pyrophosphatase MutT (NUDIX family)
VIASQFAKAAATPQTLSRLVRLLVMRLTKPLRQARQMLFGQAPDVDGGELPVQTAALPWRCTKSGKFEFLLVTSRSSQRWIIPKGWSMAGKSLAQAAAQEAYEEAGVRGKIDAQSIGSFEHVKQSVVGGPVTVLVHVFPLIVERELASWPEKEQRSRRWFLQAEAWEAIESEGLRSVVDGFARALASKSG